VSRKLTQAVSIPVTNRVTVGLLPTVAVSALSSSHKSTSTAARRRSSASATATSRSPSLRTSCNGGLAGPIPGACAPPALRGPAPLRPPPPPGPRRVHLHGRRGHRRCRVRAHPLPRPQRCRAGCRSRLHPFPGVHSRPPSFDRGPSHLTDYIFFVLLQDLAPTDVAQFDEDEIMVISFDRELPFGEGVLTMDFTGTLNDQMRGFYRRYASSYCTSLLCMPYSNYS
jgi:hypothetical protein